jgi:hypothetical protein
MCNGCKVGYLWWLAPSSTGGAYPHAALLLRCCSGPGQFWQQQSEVCVKVQQGGVAAISMSSNGAGQHLCVNTTCRSGSVVCCSVMGGPHNHHHTLCGCSALWCVMQQIKAIPLRPSAGNHAHWEEGRVEHCEQCMWYRNGTHNGMPCTNHMCHGAGTLLSQRQQRTFSMV